MGTLTELKFQWITSKDRVWYANVKLKKETPVGERSAYTIFERMFRFVRTGRRKRTILSSVIDD